MEIFNTYLNDLSSFAISALLLIVYHFYLKVRQKRNPAYTVGDVNILARTAWVEMIMRERKDILAVQTLRNSTMAATFLASTAVLLIMGVLTLSGQGEHLQSSWHSLNIIGEKHSGLWLAKLLLLLLDLLVAFFSFSMAVRVFNHVGYMINVPISLGYKEIQPRNVAIHLNRAGRFYYIGMRAYYFSVPVVFWLFGPHFMVLSSIGLVFFLYRIDRAPKIILDQEISDQRVD